MKLNKYFFTALLLLFSICENCFSITRYVTSNLNLRYEANTHSYIITVIPKGTAVTIDEDCNCAWVPVEYHGHIGYISTKYLSNNPILKSRRSKPVRYRNVYGQQSDRIRYYTNTYGNRVQSPTRYNSRPTGATALCGDGTYSFSQSRRGTCSHHGGVSQWLR